jgi:hypothetical protein
MDLFLLNYDEKKAADSIESKAKTLKEWEFNTSIGLEPEEYLLDPENPEELELELSLRAGLVENDDDDFDSE